MTHLPTQLGEITPDWLTTALQQGFPGTEVRAVDIVEPIWGTATKAFLRVDYQERNPDGPPSELCIKGGFDDAMRSVVGLGYRIEAKFYRDIAPVLGDSVPRCWYSAESENENQGIVIIDDLAAAGAQFGSLDESYSVDQVAKALESLAKLHGSSWNRTGAGALDWLTVGSQLFRPVADGFLSAPHWATYIEMEQTRSFDSALRDRERVERAVHRLWDIDDRGTLAVSHGDPHTRNTYLFDDKALRFLDWQTTCLAPWADDVSYFLVGVLDVETRRQHDAELLRHYLDALSASGGPRLDFDDAWLSYRRHHLHGLMFALCGPEMQPAEACTAMGDRYATAAIDHDTLRATEQDG